MANLPLGHSGEGNVALKTVGLIARFIDLAPEFLYVPGHEALAIAAQTGAMPFDIPGVELSPGSDGGRCCPG